MLKQARWREIALEWDDSAVGRERVVSDDQNKPVLDEQTFHKLLEAAHVLQQHARSLREMQERMEIHSDRLREQEATAQTVSQAVPAACAEVSRPTDYTVTLAEIVETQRQIQLRHLGLDPALAVIAEKVARITQANGAGIGILDGKIVRYRAAFGPSALPAGTEVPPSSAVCAASIRTGQVIRSEDVNTEMLFDPEPCRQRGILSLLAVPIYHDGNIVGALELYFDKVHGYAEQDIHTCQLLAGMVTEALGRDAELKLKNSMAEERWSMLAAIEKLPPNLAALAHDSNKPTSNSNGKATDLTQQTCWKCGAATPAAQQFCGHCGAALTQDGDMKSVQSKIATAWQRHKLSAEHVGPGEQPQRHVLPQTAHDPASAASINRTLSLRGSDSIAEPALKSEGGAAVSVTYDDPFSPLRHEEEAAPEDFSQTSELTDQPPLGGAEVREEGNRVEAEEAAVESAPSPAEPGAENQLWSSAAKTREFLERMAASQKSSGLANLWQSHRGDFYLAVAVILVVVVIRWGLWSNHSVVATGRGSQVSATSNNQPAPDNDLSLFDKLLIRLGLAEPPEAPQDKGNPDVQVWVDLHTALYYCPGADLYEKTPKGKLTTQRDAQLDGFEPASRKPCD